MPLFFEQWSVVMNDIERRVHQRARQLWEQAGRPAGGSNAYIDRARELVAIEDCQKQTTKPLASGQRTGPEGEQIATSVGPEGEPVEPVEAVENLGEFPTLTDQGEEQIPRRRRAPPRRREGPGRTARRGASAGTGRAKARSASRPNAGKKSTPARRTRKGRKTAGDRKTATPRRPTTHKKARRTRPARKRTGRP
jgi:Protein of unknown function (DUF2934)